MLRTGTQIVVTHSGITRKAGPRVGSIGTVEYIHYLGISTLPEFYHYDAHIIFTRYGYQEKIRKERKKVILVVPNLFLSTQLGQTFFNFKRILEETSLKTPIVVSPLLHLEKDKVIEAFFNIVLNHEDVVNNLKNVCYHRINNKRFLLPHNFKLSPSSESWLKCLFGNPSVEVVKILFNTEPDRFYEILELATKLKTLIERYEDIKDRQKDGPKFVFNFDVPKSHIIDYAYQNLYNPKILYDLFKTPKFRASFPNSEKRIQMYVRDSLTNGIKIINKH